MPNDRVNMDFFRKRGTYSPIPDGPISWLFPQQAVITAQNPCTQHAKYQHFFAITVPFNSGIPSIQCCCLTLNLLMSYTYWALCNAKTFNVIYIMYLRLTTLKAVSFYLLHNVSTLNQCRKFSCGTVVCKHFASYQGFPNYKWHLIR
jgi:hypothetical protein